MLSNTSAYLRATVLLLLALLVLVVEESASKPWAQSMNPLEHPTFLETTRKSCTAEFENLCQRCAKKTKSVVVYPWCCTDHEGTREWCNNYLHYGRD